jgi:hypothetical protein
MHARFCVPQKPIKIKRSNANIKIHQNLNKAIALGHSERKCCKKRSNALILSAMVVAAMAGLGGSDDMSHTPSQGWSTASKKIVLWSWIESKNKILEFLGLCINHNPDCGIPFFSLLPSASKGILDSLMCPYPQ